MGKIYTAIFATLFGASVLRSIAAGVTWLSLTWVAVDAPTSLPLSPGLAAIAFFVLAHVFAFLMVVARNWSGTKAA